MDGTSSGETRIEPEIVLRKVPGRGEGAGGAASVKNGQQKPTMADISTSREHVARELTPSELFEKVALDDAKQNRRLSAKSNGLPPTLLLLQPPSFKKVGDSSQDEVAPRPTTRVRFIICTLGLISLAMSQMSRMVLNQSITQMVDPSMMAQKQDSDVSSDGSCPWPEEADDQAPRLDDEFTTLFPPTTRLPTTLDPATEKTTTQPPEVPTTGGNALADTSPPPPPPTTLRPAVPDGNEAATSPAGPIRLQIQIQSEEDLPNILSGLGKTPSQRLEEQGPVEGQAQNPDESLDELPDFDEHEGTTSRPSAERRESAEGPTEAGSVERVFEIVTEGEDIETGGGDTNGSEAEPDTNREQGTQCEPTTQPPSTTPPPPPGGSGGLADDETNDRPKQQVSPRHPQYKWTMQQQNTLLGGFYYSYFVFMVLGGRMAEIYGAKYVLLLSVGGSALINLATPWMASTSFTLLVMSRVVMGAIQSGVFPGMYALIAKWLTMTEASIYAPLIKMNLRLGMVLGSLLPGLAEGWPNVFYLTGVLSALWSVLWLAIATSDPVDNKWVSRGELAHINRKKQKKQQPDQSSAERVVDQVEMDARGPAAAVANAPMAATQEQRNSAGAAAAIVAQKQKSTTPWVKILTAPSVIGLIIVKLTFNYALDFLAIELPSYLRYVHHASKETISAITGPMFGIQVVLIVFVGWLAKVAVQRPPLGLDKTGIRKLFQGLASFGLAATFFLLTFNDCNLTYVTILLQIISLLSMFTAGGETMLPYDLSLEYPATIMAIANSVANLSGVTTTTLTGLVLGSQGGSYYRWNILIYLIAGANLLGGLAFTFLVRAEPIDFSENAKRRDDVRDIESATHKRD